MNSCVIEPSDVLVRLFLALDSVREAQSFASLPSEIQPPFALSLSAFFLFTGGDRGRMVGLLGERWLVEGGSYLSILLS